MNKLPELESGMPFTQAIILELVTILFEQGILTEQQAIDRYEMRMKQFNLQFDFRSED